MFNIYISAREKMIIEALIVEQGEVTIKELSKKINVSSRTIHRDLNKIEELLHSYQLELIKKSGVGVQIIGQEKGKRELIKQLEEFTFREYTLDERKTMILSMLYESSEPVKLFTLSKDLGVSISTVSADLMKLEEQLIPFQLSILKKRGYGVELSGTEEAKRRAISYAIAKTLKEEGLFSLIKEQIHQQSGIHDDPISERLMHLVDRKKLLKIEDVMKDLYPNLSFSMTDNSYIGLIVHLALAIERILQGENIQIEKMYLKQIALEPEYPIAKKIIDKLMDSFQVDIPEAEVGYITMHLQGAKLRQQDGILHEASNLETYMQAKKLIQLMEKATGYQLMNNESLLEGLVTHLKPAIYRIRQNMGIFNPLLKNIQKDYEELFEQVKVATEIVFPTLIIPDEEIGYLVMHFGSALLGLSGKGDLKAYIICSSGIGTSKLLASRLQREIPEIAEVINVSIFEVNELSLSDRDLVISTIYLQGFHREYMMVSPFMTKDEITQVQLYARKQMLLKKTVPAMRESDSTLEVLKKKMEKIHLYTGTIVDILTNFHITTTKNHISARECILSACNLLEEQQIILNAPIVVEALFARETLGGIGIPETKLALYHTRIEKVCFPSFTIHKLAQPVIVKGMDGNEMEVHTLLLLLSPQPFHEPGLEVLSLISTIIIENEQSIKLFETEDVLRIQAYLAEKFEHFIDGKLK
ncbi:BglG family transcription antiterminator [Psychrobacillus sp. NPDC058041]|uniref:BglG family transcription antiterminator n=1 Tax=Psychrobacillus sp. NPDC058041 TaxID=3346310 RepID=UPI0036DC92B2